MKQMFLMKQMDLLMTITVVSQTCSPSSPHPSPAMGRDGGRVGGRERGCTNHMVSL